MADQLKATDRQTELFDKRFTQLTETMLNGFVRLEDKFDKKTDILADEIRGTNQRVDKLTDRVDNLAGRVDNLTDRVDHLTDRVDHLTDRVDNLTDRVDNLTEEVREVKNDVRDIKAETQVTNRRLSATFAQAGRLTEENTDKDQRLHQLETEEPTNAELNRRVLALEEFMRRAS